jgi:hypothetical protein
VVDYYPFGGIRVNQQATSTLGEQRRFTGHEFDTGTENARLNVCGVE